MADAFPTISYSSSEDEDDAEFFDANEYENDRLVSTVTCQKYACHLENPNFSHQIMLQ
jgi:hypothetical protein